MSGDVNPALDNLLEILGTGVDVQHGNLNKRKNADPKCRTVMKAMTVQNSHALRKTILQICLGFTAPHCFALAAEALLQEANGSVEAAVSKYFSQAPPDRIDPPPSPFSALKALIGSDVSDLHLRALLEQSGNAVEGALDLHLEGQANTNEASGPAMQGHPVPGYALKLSIFSQTQDVYELS